MKKFFVSIVLAAAAAFAAPAFAEAKSVDISGLSAEQQAQVKTILDAAKAESPNKVVEVSKAARSEVDKWGELIVGAAVSGARQANMVVDEFSQTTVGKVTIAVVVYKMIGKDLIRYAVGSFIALAALAIGWGLWFTGGHRLRITSCEREIKPILWGAFHKMSVTKEVRKYDGDSDYTAFGVVVTAAGFVLGSMVAFI